MQLDFGCHMVHGPHPCILPALQVTLVWHCSLALLLTEAGAKPL